VKDSKEAERAAQVLATSASQINFVLPPDTANGTATITVSNDGKVVVAGTVAVDTVAPGLFAANGSGMDLAAGLAVRVAAGGTQSTQFLTAPVDVSRAGDQVTLVLFGTGMRGAAQKTTATIGGVAVGVAGPLAQSEYAGLDQVNLGPLPSSLAGRGVVAIVLSVDRKAANTVTVNIQ
jgi:uncharacterized protein (TIGR03437 family)